MSQTINQNLPDPEDIISIDKEKLAGFVLEHLHTLSANQWQQASSNNIANDVSRSYPTYKDKIYAKVLTACEWLLINDYLEIRNAQRFFVSTDKGRAVRTAKELSSKREQHAVESKYNLPKIPLSEPELIWMKEIYAKFIEREEPDIRALKSKLFGKIPKDFNPNSVDRRLLLNGTELTLLGIWHVNPNTDLVQKTDLVINCIRDLLNKSADRKAITAEEVARLIDVPREDTGKIFKLLGTLGRFYSSYRGGLKGGHSEIHIEGDKYFDIYYQYPGIEQTIIKSFEILGAHHPEPLMSLERINSERSDPKHGVDVAAKYIFLDIVGFTHNRSTEAQADIVKYLNEIVSKTVKEKSIPEDKRIFIPTGDGICIVLLSIEAPVDIHMQIALSILDHINSYNDSIQNETRQVQVRIGIDANTDTLVADINNQQNIAGAGISMASRIMNLADGNQILVGQAVYETLRHREKYTNAFKAFQATVKHGTQLSIHQFTKEGCIGLNTNVPSKFITEAAKPSLVPNRGLDFSAFDQAAEQVKSLLRELEFNLRIVNKPDYNFAPLRTTDYDVAISSGWLSTLDPELRTLIDEAYDSVHNAQSYQRMYESGRTGGMKANIQTNHGIPAKNDAQTKIGKAVTKLRSIFEET